MKKKLIVFLSITFLYLANSSTYAQSSFIVHKTSKKAENDLHLVGYHINKVSDRHLRDDQNFTQGYFQEYVVFNKGDVPHKAEFGAWYQDSNDIPQELFRINGANVRHQIALLNELGEFELSYMTVGYFAFIEVVFPPRVETKIRVNDFFSSHLSYNNFILKSSPQFTATIGNRFIDRFRPYFEIEEYWINDIFINDRRESLVSLLEQKSSLSNDLFTIQKTNGNTWNIKFTKKFVDSYRPNLTIDIEWGNWGRIGGYYNPSWDDNRGLVFDCEKRITPYQYIFLTNRQLLVLRNAYYARHGYIFRNPALVRIYRKEDVYFEINFGNIHYRENPNFTEAMLTETDRANIAIIQRLEALAGN